MILNLALLKLHRDYELSTLPCLNPPIGDVWVLFLLSYFYNLIRFICLTINQFYFVTVLGGLNYCGTFYCSYVKTIVLIFFKFSTQKNVVYI
jgi:hypothetical protein